MPQMFQFSMREGVSDTRKPYEKTLALYFILASTLFERMGSFALTNILLTTLSNDLFNWKVHDSRTTLLIFSGKSYINCIDSKTFRANESTFVTTQFPFQF